MPPSRADRAHMRRALALARRGWGQVAPNPMVGAVVVRGEERVGEGWHARFGERHAERAALEAAGERARGATLYVTLEPCAHHGKTPPCTEAIVAAGVRRVVVAARDPNPAAAGGVERLRAAGIEVEAGVERQAALDLDPAFFHGFSSDRPFVTLKLAVSLDAALADHTRRPGWLTGERSRRLVHRMRAGADAIAVGIGTALADDPELTVRHAPRPRVAPTRVVFDRRARLPLESRLARSAGDVPVVVVRAEGADGGADGGADDRARGLEAAGVTVVAAPSLAASLRLLRARGIGRLLVEGGAGISGALLADGLVDRLIIFQAPLILGAGALPAFGDAPAVPVHRASRLRVVRRQALGDDLMTEYALTGGDSESRDVHRAG